MRKKITAVALVAVMAVFLFAGCVEIESVKNLFEKQKEIDTGDNSGDKGEIETEIPPLTFSEDGKFKILQLSDFHEWLGIEHPDRIEFKDDLKPNLKRYILTLLEEEKPDFVTITGDNVFCLSGLSELTHKVTLKTYQAIAEVFEQAQVYWTFTFGNHDAEGLLVYKKDMLKAVSDYKYFIGGMSESKYYKSFSLEKKDADGEDDHRYANFSIPVFTADGSDIAYNIFMLDSGSYNYPPKNDIPYRYILKEQSDWYDSEVKRLKELNGGAIVPSIMFTHIPFLEFADIDQDTTTGSLWGFSPSDKSSPIFETLVNNKDVKAIFFGHNHQSSLTGFYTKNGARILMGITPQCATESYEVYDDPYLRGRRITLTKDGDIETVILTSNRNRYPTGVEEHTYISYLNGANN